MTATKSEQQISQLEAEIASRGKSSEEIFYRHAMAGN